jgi:hypothetical protein
MALVNHFKKRGIMIRTTTYIIFALVVASCSASQPHESDQGLNISRIHIDPTSKGRKDSPEMITRCSGFILSEKLVRDFLTYASRIKTDEPDKYYSILPCSSTGTAVIDKRKYNWIIRAGGIGEFTADGDRFVVVCGKNCCDKVPGIC